MTKQERERKRKEGRKKEGGKKAFSVRVAEQSITISQIETV